MARKRTLACKTFQVLASHFAIKDMGEVQDYLGMDVTRDRGSRLIVLSQQRYTRQLVREYGMQHAKTASQPIACGVKLVSSGLAGGLAEQPLPDAAQGGKPTAGRYRALVGALLYLANGTRPHLSQAVGALTRFEHTPLVGVNLHHHAPRPVWGLP